MRRILLAAALPAAALLPLAACTSSGTSAPSTAASSAPVPATSTPAPATSSRPTSSPAPAPATSSAAPAPAYRRAFDRMTEQQRVGQLLMVDCPTGGPTAATAAAITQHAVGSVILDGTSYAGRSEIAAVTQQVQSLAPRRVGLLVATDQEGGLVQRLQGPGFTRIPPATEQGTLDPATLQAQTRSWATELRRAGVNVDLAPVLDTVPAGFGSNPPIGDLDRQYGDTPQVVAEHGLAVARGLLAAGVDPSVKHFPGLGRVHGNTDLASDVTDTVTTRDDPYLEPFRQAVRAGVPFVMISTAIYARLDAGTPAAFSSRIVTGLLRGTFGFRGLVISDDLGIAAQVAGVPVGDRAVRFVAAGGDVVLTVDATQAGEMTAALLDRARSDPAFRRQVDAAALRVLREKQRLGLLG